jgi:hypothetical protein
MRRDGLGTPYGDEAPSADTSLPARLEPAEEATLHYAVDDKFRAADGIMVFDTSGRSYTYKFAPPARAGLAHTVAQHAGWRLLTAERVNEIAADLDRYGKDRSQQSCVSSQRRQAREGWCSSGWRTTRRRGPCQMGSPGATTRHRASACSPKHGSGGCGDYQWRRCFRASVDPRRAQGPPGGAFSAGHNLRVALGRPSSYRSRALALALAYSSDRGGNQ